MNNTSLIIPIFNEELNIKNLYNEICQADILTCLDEIIFVDDCSCDSSLNIMIEIEKNDLKVKILKHSKRLGQSACLKTASKYTKFATLITIDGDGQNNPKDIPLLLKEFHNDNNLYLVGGLRINRKDNLIKKYASKLANKTRMFILNDGCIDTGCSLKVFEKDTFNKFPFFNGMHRFIPALFSGYGKKTFFIPVDHRARKLGKSKYATFGLGRLYRGVIDIIKVVIIINKFKRDNA